jgi:hypothetical protein
MRRVKWNAFLSGLCAFGMVLGVVVGGAHADVTTEKGASILVFPKVQANGSTDTVIQIANTGNSVTYAHCYYVNASLTNTITGAPCDLPSQTCVPLWQETDFDIVLTRWQPTHWLVSTGRRVDPFDGFGNDGSGFDPGLIPPESDFSGELKCIQVDETGQPWTSNNLIGEATLETIAGPDTGDVSKYNAVGIPGNPDSAGANPLLLDDNMYAACPAQLLMNNFATGASDAVADLTEASGSSVSTELTLVPCSEDFENQIPTSTTVQFLIYNEFEERFSASTTVTCYLSTQLTNIDSPLSPDRSVFSAAVLGTDVATTTITPVAGNGAVIGLAERTVAVTASGIDGGATLGETVTRSARAAYSLHTNGSLIPAPGAPDKITLAGQ